MHHRIDEDFMQGKAGEITDPAAAAFEAVAQQRADIAVQQRIRAQGQRHAIAGRKSGEQAAGKMRRRRPQPACTAQKPGAMMSHGSQAGAVWSATKVRRRSFICQNV